MIAENPPTVLVVDDDADNCQSLTDILTDLGYRVDTAADGLAGLTKVQAQPYDIALLDYKMPGMSGLELYHQIRQLRSGTVAILVSAYTDPATRDAALGAGVWRVLPKPVDLSRLLALVSEAVGQPLVLIVDDDPDLCASLWDILRQRGYRVCLAGDAKTAADRLKDCSYKVVLVDLRLPDADGTAVIRAAREITPMARAVVITGLPEAEPLVQESMLESVDAIYYKPLDIARLLESLDRLAR
ncbi:MAG TPA: response regulator [Gemmataceae bacterium]|nr:response regulator [Gemmataceae bacterium]